MNTRKIRIGMIVLGILLIGVFSVNAIIEKVMMKNLSDRLDDLSKKSEYILELKGVDVNIFSGNISLVGFSATPGEALFDSLRSETSQQKVLSKISVTRASLTGLRVFKLLLNKHLIIDEIALEQLVYSFYKPKRKYQVKSVEKDKNSKLAIDTLYFPGLKNIDIDRMRIANYSIHIIDGSSSDTISSYSGGKFMFNGMGIKTLDAEKGFFAFDNSRLELSLEKQEFQLSNGLYAVAFDKLYYPYYLRRMELLNLRYFPVAEPAAFSARFPYSYEIFNISIDSLLIDGIDTRPMFRSGVFDMEEIEIVGLEGHILKDKTKPFDEDKVTLLPQMALEQFGQPLHIDSISIRKSSFIYSEKIPNSDLLVEVGFDDIEGSVGFVTSIQDSLNAGRSLDIKLNALLLKSLPISLHVDMPYNRSGHPIYFSGYTKGTTSFENLNPTVFPAIGMRFENGSLDGMQFSITANPEEANGSLTLLYTDLEVEMLKEDLSENKKVSWLANSLIKQSNPNRNGKISVSEVYYQRLKYKGIGNYLWKSIQSGIVNSLVPFGKRKKQK